jgi:uncharacterized membrane protein
MYETILNAKLEVMQLQEELDHAMQKLALLEKDHQELRYRAEGYRIDWINEYCRAELLSMEFSDGGLSQARWETPSPY